MIPATSFDPSRRLDFYLRVSRDGSKVLVFLDADGNAYDISALTFEFFVKTNAGERKDVFRLTEGNGLTKVSNTLTIDVTADQTNIREGEYYCELYLAGLVNTWLSGKLFAHNGEFDGVNQDLSTLTINASGDTVTILVSAGNSLTVDRLISTLQTATEEETEEILDSLRPVRYDNGEMVFYDNGKVVAYDRFEGSSNVVDALYIGDPNTDGSWRQVIVGQQLSIQRRDSGVWTEYQSYG